MEKRYRVNLESGMVHDLTLPCWWAVHIRPKHTSDFATEEEALAALQALGVTSVICGRCVQRRTSKRFLAQQENGPAQANKAE